MARLRQRIRAMLGKVGGKEGWKAMVGKKDGRLCGKRIWHGFGKKGGRLCAARQGEGQRGGQGWRLGFWQEDGKVLAVCG